MNTLNRNFEYEQHTGFCSYCGGQLEIICDDCCVDCYFDTCHFCDEYENEQALEEMFYNEGWDFEPDEGEDFAGVDGDVPF